MSDAPGGDRRELFNAQEWLNKLRECVDKAGGAEVIHVVEGSVPRIRRAKAEELVELTGIAALDDEELDSLALSIIGESGQAALKQTGEAEMPLMDWKGASGEIWVCQVFGAQRGHYRLIFRRYRSMVEWLQME